MVEILRPPAVAGDARHPQTYSRFLHIVVVPILLGRGLRFWDGMEGLETD